MTSSPAVIRQDCAERLAEVERAEPTIVFEAKDRDGLDVSAVTVTMDDTPLASSLDGSALSTDPGEHVFARRSGFLSRRKAPGSP